MRWVVLGLLSLTIWLAPAYSMSEPPNPCPPVSSARQALKTLEDSFSRHFNPDTDVPSIKFSPYADLCGREPAVVACAGGGDGKLPLEQVERIDATLRAEFHYRDDILAFGKDDYWTAYSLCSDCEDYALHLSEMLHTAGQGGENMGLVMWFMDRTIPHASLAVNTADAGTVEISVGDGGRARPMDWRDGIRVAVLWMDGSRKVSAVPGWPAPIVQNGGVMAPTVAHKK